MGIGWIIGTVFSVYFLVLIVNFILKLVMKEEQSWMKILDQICAPAKDLGKVITEKLFAGKTFNFDMPLLMGAVLVLVVGWVIGGILGIIGL